MSDNHITVEEITEMFAFTIDDIPGETRAYMDGIDTNYVSPTLAEFEQYVLDILKRIDSPYIVRNREENISAFDSGWKENLEAIKAGGISQDLLKPKYFRPSNFLRYKKGLIVPDNIELEYDLFVAARQLIFNKYLKYFDNIYEIGCGSCQNLFLLSLMFPDKNLYGLDWTLSSVDIATFIGASTGIKIVGHLFDMVYPFSSGIEMCSGSAVITVHALEQIGSEYGQLLKFLIESRPGIIVHYEPVGEFYDENNLLDFLAVLYSRKRNYLSGFLETLKAMENKGIIEILEARRPFLGGVIHESSLIAWRPR